MNQVHFLRLLVEGYDVDTRKPVTTNALVPVESVKQAHEVIAHYKGLPNCTSVTTDWTPFPGQGINASDLERAQ